MTRAAGVISVEDVSPHERFEGVYWVKFQDRSRRLATRNLSPGRSVYGEELVKFRRREYRLWDAHRSKLAAAILKEIKEIPITSGRKVLYLGAASGTTASHVSDITGEEGSVFCVEFAQRTIRELIEHVCSNRPNMSPILADARHPSSYRSLVSPVDVIYCDIAQPEQARILADNADLFLKESGSAMIAVKSRSVDVTMSPASVFSQEKRTLMQRGFRITDTVRLEPYEKDHAMIIVRKQE
ncbi:fibrillarin-like rRNA/tRNA 2'-O-methyltransferase [[Eubacterium] cellulosolvens]